MNNLRIISIEEFKEKKYENEPHEVAELICLECFYRFIGVFHKNTLLKEMICPKCACKSTIIKTGQTLPEEV